MSSTRGDLGPCRCVPCCCTACGEVIGVYEPLVALPAGGGAVRGSQLSLAGRLDLDRVPLYHDECYGAPAPAPVRPGGAP